MSIKLVFTKRKKRYLLKIHLHIQQHEKVRARCLRTDKVQLRKKKRHYL
jgi:hypothetical protein